ncbi:unnamed protein product [Effrenium voratum]|uniref:Coatomer subunit beta n=1 Tax=Effrenium voratum TaxID=2562239 RepID=A0AA36J3Z3_9DINO|nr:unnamed protein product [Effrenium voratum]
MSVETEKYCTVLIHYEKGVPPTSEELAKKLESKKETVQAEALEELVLLMINGESYPKLLMTIIRFVVTSRDHRVKKLLTIYWEIVEKTKDNGDLKEEMILVCNALRNDLMHANEYVCGSTLRLLCKMKYYRILEPLKEAVLRNLGHRHSYVRRNAVMCVFSIVKSFGVEVLPEAPEDIEQLLLVEGDLSTKRNAFLMLVNCDQDMRGKDVVALLKKEVIKTLGYEASNTEGNLEYRRLLIRALHACTGQYPDQAQSVMFLLMDFLTESDQTTATEVVMFLRELIANYSDMRMPILQRLAECVGDVSQSRVLRGCLWLFGEYCEDEALILSVIQAVLAALRPLPLAVEDGAKDKKEAAGDKKEKKAPKITTKTVVLADGTYGTQNVYEGGEGEEEEVEDKGKTDTKKTAFRTLLLGGDFLLSAMVGVSLTKLCIKLKNLPVALRNEVLLVIVNIFKLVKQHVCGGEKCDSAVRLSQCIRAFAVMGNSQLPPPQLAAAQLVQGDWGAAQGRGQLAKVLELAAQNSEWALGQEEEVQEKSVAPDECIVFRQLRERKGGAGPAGGMDDDEDFHAARGASMAQAAADGALFAERLAKVQQMTGLADPVYVEAFLQVHSFDLMLELLVVNRTNETLQNVLVELSTQGDLKLVDRPSAVTLAAGQQMTLHASIKVASTETGIIFGYVTFEKKSAADKECSVLNELHVDILDYIERSWINELAFRTMWSEFEWENKVNINTSITEVGTFLEHIMRNTNMSIVGRSYKKTGDNKTQKKGKLTAEDVQDMLKDAVGIKKLIDTSSFVAVNLYAKSIFGEDALANISIEKLPDGKLTGSCRIRSRTQGIALSLGDRITIVQRGVQASRE